MKRVTQVIVNIEVPNDINGFDADDELTNLCLLTAITRTTRELLSKSEMLKHATIGVSRIPYKVKN